MFTVTYDWEIYPFVDDLEVLSFHRLCRQGNYSLYEFPYAVIYKDGEMFTAQIFIGEDIKYGKLYEVETLEQAKELCEQKLQLKKETANVNPSSATSGLAGDK